MLLWTPGYWDWDDGLYIWHEGYWGPEVGFYGGVDYGFGYPGVGFYGGYWHGRKTADGEIYNQNTFTAAHKTLPFNSRVKVSLQT